MDRVTSRVGGPRSSSPAFPGVFKRGRVRVAEKREAKSYGIICRTTHGLINDDFISYQLLTDKRQRIFAFAFCSYASHARAPALQHRAALVASVPNYDWRLAGCEPRISHRISAPLSPSEATASSTAIICSQFLRLAACLLRGLPCGLLLAHTAHARARAFAFTHDSRAPRCWSDCACQVSSRQQGSKAARQQAR